MGPERASDYLGWASRRLTLPIFVLFALSLTGCRLHVELIQDDGGWQPAEFEVIEIGRSRIDDVLNRLGPPDAVSYTRTTEVLEYRSGGHRGSDLTFLLPSRANPVSGFFNGIRGALSILFPEFEDTEEFNQKGYSERVSRAMIEFLFSFTPLSFSADDSVTLHDRRIRYDVIQIVLGRDDHIVKRKEMFLGVEYQRSENLMGSALLVSP